MELVRVRAQQDVGILSTENKGRTGWGPGQLAAAESALTSRLMHFKTKDL